MAMINGQRVPDPARKKVLAFPPFRPKIISGEGWEATKLDHPAPVSNRRCRPTGDETVSDGWESVEFRDEVLFR
jgi:hypothetical protein